jgi:benzoate-CoA ligase
MSLRPARLPDGCYNAALDLLDRNLEEGRGEALAVIDDAGRYSYAELTERANRFANALEALGFQREERLLLALHDTVDFPTAFLGAIKAGVIPVPVNTLLTEQDYAHMLADSGARGLVVSAPLRAKFGPALQQHGRHLRTVIVSGAEGEGSLTNLLVKAPPQHEPAATHADDFCFWLYSSGSTGAPKGAVHLHGSLMATAKLYAQPVLGIRASDRVFSAAKLFFAYGLGNALTFPFSVGATAILMAERPTPASVVKRLVEQKATIFYGVPTLYSLMLSGDELPPKDKFSLRLCVSAGEALPEELGKRWKERTGVDILDGIGSTEMLHIFISNRLDDLRYGSSGRPVEGYEAKLVGEDGRPVAAGEIGDLLVAGPTCCVLYWRKREKSRETFLGAWTRTGDKYRLDEEGYWVYCGRSDDMLKVSGQYVSPFEVEAALVTHPAVLEAAVVAHYDEDRLVKPKAYVVLKDARAGGGLEEELKVHVKGRLAPFKYPRWIEFVPELPKTATGKIQRFKLRRSG